MPRKGGQEVDATTSQYEYASMALSTWRVLFRWHTTLHPVVGLSTAAISPIPKKHNRRQTGYCRRSRQSPKGCAMSEGIQLFCFIRRPFDYLRSPENGGGEDPCTPILSSWSSRHMSVACVVSCLGHGFQLDSLVRRGFRSLPPAPSPAAQGRAYPLGLG